MGGGGGQGPRGQEEAGHGGRGVWPGMRPGGRGGPAPGEGAGQREGRVLHGDDLAATGRENLQEVRLKLRT